MSFSEDVELLLFDYTTGTLSLEEHLIISAFIHLNPKALNYVHTLDLMGGHILENLPPSALESKALPPPLIKTKEAHEENILIEALTHCLEKKAPLQLKWENADTGIQEIIDPNTNNLRLSWFSPGSTHQQLETKMSLILHGYYSYKENTLKAGNIELNTKIEPTEVCPEEGCVILSLLKS